MADRDRPQAPDSKTEGRGFESFRPCQFFSVEPFASPRGGPGVVLVRALTMCTVPRAAKLITELIGTFIFLSVIALSGPAGTLVRSRSAAL